MQPTRDARGYRLAALDLLRGLVIVVMALDHVRDYFHAGAAQEPLADPNVGLALFFTRWVTHFCAPVFVFLAGVSAGLMAGRKTRADVGAFLAKRGLWLIAVEWLVIATAFSFAPRGVAEIGGFVFTPMQVLGAIGMSMIVLAAVQLLGRTACFVAGVAIVAGHNLLDPIWPQVPNAFDTSQPLWVGLHAQVSTVVGPFLVIFAYPVLAWIGVMLAGYGCAAVFELSSEDRDRWLWRGGLSLTAAFVVIRALGVYGDPNPWHAQEGGLVRTALDFLNVTKYPPSLLFLLMTLGPSAALCSRASAWQGPVARFFITYGRAPFAFYVAHFYLIHALSVALGVAQGFAASQLLTYMAFYPKGYGLPLVGVYVVWGIVVAALYPLVRWVTGVKARRTDWWLSYL